MKKLILSVFCTYFIVLASCNASNTKAYDATYEDSVLLEQLKVKKSLATDEWNSVLYYYIRRNESIYMLISSVESVNENFNPKILHELRKALAEANLANIKGYGEDSLSVKESTKHRTRIENNLLKLLIEVEKDSVYKSNEHFRRFMKELDQNYKEIVSARENYNSKVESYNYLIESSKAETNPVLIGFKKMSFIEVDSEDMKAPKVKF